MPSKFQSIFLGGVAAAVIGAVASLVPILGSCLGCLAYIAAGFIAVWHYTGTPTPAISGGTGAGMGAGAGAVAGLAGALLSVASQTLGITPGFSEEIDRVIAERQISGEQAEMMRSVVESPLFYVAIAAFLVVIGAVLGAVGGVIGASVFKRGGDAPGSGPEGDGPGGPRTPASPRGSQPSGPQQARTPERQPASRSEPAEEYRPPVREEEGAATPQP